MLEAWKNFSGVPQELELPSAPKQFLNYFEEDNRPQAKLDRMLENGMAVSIGRLREDTQYDYKFVCLSHNTLRGAAGGAVLMAEFGVEKALVCTYQAISGAGKTFDTMPEIVDNVIPFIGGEEEKSEQEP